MYLERWRRKSKRRSRRQSLSREQQQEKATAWVQELPVPTRRRGRSRRAEAVSRSLGSSSRRSSASSVMSSAGCSCRKWSAFSRELSTLVCLQGEQLALEAPGGPPGVRVPSRGALVSPSPALCSRVKSLVQGSGPLLVPPGWGPCLLASR